MNTPWYQKLFSPSEETNLGTTKAKADHGDADAQFSLGLKFANGKGKTRDYVQAAQWYHRAAAQSHSLAEFNLGVMYANGQGVRRDDATAVTWIRKAAHHGDAGAQFSLGIRYHRASMGRLPMDAIESRIEAYKWLQLAAAQGYQGSAAACESVTLIMTLADVTDGKQRIAAFVAERDQPSQAQQVPSSQSCP